MRPCSGNYVDLRFRSAHTFRIEAELTADALVIRFRSESVNQRLVLPTSSLSKSKQPDQIENCFSCGTEDCFRQVKPSSRHHDFGRTAYLLDEYWPEFDRYISAKKRCADLLCLPLDGKNSRKPNYAWTTTGFGTVKQSRLLTLRRSYQSRRLATQGATRQKYLLVANERLAQRYASLLSYDVTHVTLMQHLLPSLWREGHLGGRTFDVLMTGLPLAVLQQRLDAAFKLHPESRTLADFRADDQLLEAESEALRQARRIITPHTQIAALYPDKSVLLDWVVPETQMARAVAREVKLVFPAATVARKGIYELRAALQGLDIQLLTMGPLLEGKDFWDGIRVHRSCQNRLREGAAGQSRPPAHAGGSDYMPAGEEWLAGATAVVLPSFVEHRPRRLLEAVARGVPVIASKACGLENVSGVTSVPAGDVESLRAEIEKIISCSSLVIALEQNYQSMPAQILDSSTSSPVAAY